MQDADERQQRLWKLYQELDQANPFSTMEIADFSAQRGLIDLRQFIDIFEGCHTGNPEPLKGKITKREDGSWVLQTAYDPEIFDDTLTEIYSERFLPYKVGKIKTATATAAQAHVVRAEFYRERIRESRNHLVVRKLADKLLEAA